MKQVRFVEFSPTGIKCGINLQTPPTIGEIAQTIRSGCLLSNNTAISQVFELNCKRFDTMYAKRAFVHWHVGEGMSEGEHSEAREDISHLIDDYEEVSTETQEVAQEDEYYPEEF